MNRTRFTVISFKTMKFLTSMSILCFSPLRGIQFQSNFASLFIIFPSMGSPFFLPFSSSFFLYLFFSGIPTWLVSITLASRHWVSFFFPFSLFIYLFLDKLIWTIFLYEEFGDSSHSKVSEYWFFFSLILKYDLCFR